VDQERFESLRGNLETEPALDPLERSHPLADWVDGASGVGTDTICRMRTSTVDAVSWKFAERIGLWSDGLTQ